MKALVCQSDRTLTWQSVEEPAPADDELLISVKAASINFPDALVIEGKYQIRLEPPFIPGMEVAGEVLATGAAIRGFTVGDRVSAVLPEFGGFAERITVHADHAVQIPDKLPFDIAACVPSVWATVYYGLVHRAALVTGETVLVLGAAGGIGSASITLAKKLGATVIAAVGSEHKATIARSLGADHVINYSQCSLKEKVKDITQGQGADIVIDPVGGDLTEQALRAIAWDGRHLVIGFAAGDIPAISTHLLLLKSASMVGVNFGGFTANFGGSAKKICETVNDMMANDHSIWPLISSHIPMQAGSEAIASLPGRNSIGKIVLTLDA